ncbi:AsnC family transcriptional regulator [Leifsonia poae]|uniref:Lrp/AsnC family transcriptional regulator n=1 Tax=Leifsonia poae TaxID=110933 RepID=UPI003D69BDA5
MPIRHERSAPERDDALDASLVRALQADGRASIHELARAVGASRDVVSRRLGTLIGRNGLRVVAALDPGFAGLNVLIHGLVEVDGPARPVAERIAELPDTVFVSLVAGGSSLVFESRHGDGDELSATLTAIRQLPGVRRVRVTTYDALLKEFITAASVTDVRLDRLDHDLIAILQDDGRASYRALADAVRLSPRRPAPASVACSTPASSGSRPSTPAASPATASPSESGSRCAARRIPFTATSWRRPRSTSQRRRTAPMTSSRRSWAPRRRASWP